MTTTVCITAFKYEELDQDAKAKVGYWLNDNENPWEDDKDYWLEQLKELGYRDIDFAYSGFYSQGDGASIACKVDVAQFIKRNKMGKKYRRLLYWIKREYDTHYVKIVRSTAMRYVHQYMIDADVSDLTHDLECIEQLESYNRPNDPIYAEAQEVGEMVLEEVREWSMKIYKSLQDQWEYQFTDEFLIEGCEANGYLFDKRGNPVHHL